MDFTRRSALAAGTLLGIAGLFPPLAARAQSAPAVKRGGTITASMDLEPVSLYPLKGNAPGVDRYIMNQIFDALFRIEPDGSISPGLATKYEYSDDNKVLTLTLRAGVKFHDGTPFDAEAAAFNIMAANDPKTVATHAKDLAEIDKAEAIDPTTLRLTLKKPSGAILAVLGTEPAMMCSPTAMREKGDAFGRNPVGTGPFKFKSWASGEAIELDRFEDYWEKGQDGKSLPYLDGMKMRFISNNATKIIEMQGGNLTLADAITPRDAEKLKSDARIKLLDPPGGIQSWISFNTQKAPFDNVHVRRAIVAAINRPALLQAIALGKGATPPVMFAPNEWAYSEKPAPSDYSVDLAKKELELAGVGPNFSCTLSVIQRDPDVQIAQILQAMLSQAGIKLNVQVSERQAWVQSIMDAKFEIGLGRWAIPYPDPDQICGSVLGRGALNWANLRDDEIKGMAIKAAQSVDRETRKNVYHDIQSRLIDQAYYLFLIMRGVNHISSSQLHGVRFESNGPWYLSSAYLA
ncbi:ABC transporter substrate-binding protein [Neorhizobium sp. DT-125]|uniref:ABC transporter substrate-binding protein n=1 Tax=Neorhizobium sp. DT-125 TaxID=3396163 RepID=UPI003F1C2E24